MNLLEYEAKDILNRYSIPIPKSMLLRRDDESPAAPIVLKSQVHSGGRGKAGGVRVLLSGETKPTADSLFDLAIKDEKPKTLLAEELLLIDREFYVSLMINRSDAHVELVAHREGGIEVESHEPNEFFRQPIDVKSVEAIGQSLADFLDITAQVFALQDLLQHLVECFSKSDALLLEINPLVLTQDGKLVAGDCKMILDDAAAFRHSEWAFEQMPQSANFVTLDRGGTVATIANGAGLAMATVDAVKAAGLTPANFLDIGGGATVEGIVRSFQAIMEFPCVDAIVVNIFGGIVRCDDVARAIIEAKRQFSDLPQLYIRLSGTRSIEAAELLQAEHLTLYPDLPSCLQELTHG